MGEKAIHSRNIRWIILLILHQSRQQGRAESGGWVGLALLRKLLATQGYALTENELKDFCIYLTDDEIHCVETKRSGDAAPFSYRYRITSRGVRALDGEEKIPGVGLYSHLDED